MKKILTLILALALVVTAFACATPVVEPASNDTPQTTENSVTTAPEQVTAAPEQVAIAFCYQDLETEFWVAAHKAITETLAGQGIKVIEFNANEDANRQLEQVKNAINQGVSAIILIPQDGDSAVTICGVANEANVPIGVFGRPPTDKSNNAVVVTSSEIAICTPVSEYIVEVARQKFEETGKKLTPLIIVGDLGDVNAVDRKNAFFDVMSKNMDIFNDIIEVPSKWDSAVALANFTSAMQANPDVDLVYVSSDFLYPQVQAVLEPLGKWKPIGDPNHVILCGIDGDLTAGRLMDEKIVDATGVHDLYAMADTIMNQLIDAINAGEKQPNSWTPVPGFALTQANMGEMRMKMWGNILRQLNGDIQ